jgi:hypothetical protein
VDVVQTYQTTALDRESDFLLRFLIAPPRAQPQRPRTLITLAEELGGPLGNAVVGPFVQLEYIVHALAATYIRPGIRPDLFPFGERFGPNDADRVMEVVPEPVIAFAGQVIDSSPIPWEASEATAKPLRELLARHPGQAGGALLAFGVLGPEPSFALVLGIAGGVLIGGPLWGISTGLEARLNAAVRGHSGPTDRPGPGL